MFISLAATTNSHHTKIKTIVAKITSSEHHWLWQLSPILIDLREHECGAAWDVNAEMIAATGIAFGERLVDVLGIDAIKSTELGGVGVQNYFVFAGNFDALKENK